VRQVLGAIAQFDKATTVAKLKAAQAVSWSRICDLRLKRLATAGTLLKTH
jgi:hypothetical protein